MNIKQYRYLLLSALLFAGCSTQGVAQSTSSATADSQSEAVTLAASDISSLLNLEDEDYDESYDDATAVHITLNEETAEADSSNGVTISDGVITISKSGTYVLSGTYNGRIVVTSQDEGTVRIVLNGVSITSSQDSAIEITDANKTIITAVSTTENTLTDSTNYSSDEDAPTAALFSKDDLVINGSGTLTVNGNYNDGITSKDDLYIINTNVTVNATDDGIIGKDVLYLTGSAINVTAGGDGLKASNDTDAEMGDVLIDSGTVNVTAGDDGIQSISLTEIAGGEINITTGAGAEGSTKNSGTSGQDGNMPFGGGGFGPGNVSSSSDSAQDYAVALADETSTDPDTTDSEDSQSSYHKGITSDGEIRITDGTVTINSEDDAINTAGDITISGGTINIQAGDDGMHADGTLEIDGGTITVAKSYEGLEGMYITITGGDVNVTASDDGVNSSNPDSSASMQEDGSVLTITGGNITVYADGDGVDMNGTGTMSGGTLIVYGPTSNADSALDENGTFTVTGGTILAGGSSGMLEYPEVSGDAYMISIGTNGNGTITIVDSSGNTIAEYSSEKTFTNLAYISTDLQNGATYTIYEDGEELGSVTISDSISYLNNSSTNNMGDMGNMNGGMGGMGGPMNH